MTILEIIDLPIYKQMSGREKWRNHHVNNGLRKQSTGSLDLMSNKGVDTENAENGKIQAITTDGFNVTGKSR